MLGTYLGGGFGPRLGQHLGGGGDECRRRSGERDQQEITDDWDMPGGSVGASRGARIAGSEGTV